MGADGTLDTADSKNITSSYASSHTGQYCLDVAVPLKSVVASGDMAGTASFVGADLSPGDISVSCTAAPANVLVIVFSPAGTPAPNPFYIVFD